ncbi:rhox homeobox family member 2-like [Apodemus sylvaticus]|uniref:rhox homeobox family member 2-like n=1 Tax=Apodemus sylvaticus TaxID=10129 RepID=UPI002242D1E2|nr:rhox homeobox family member 2-like [Apodemus sylvaticus]
METPQDSRQPSQRPLSLGAENDQEQQHGGNAVVSRAGEEGGDKKGLVLSGFAQGGLDQGERTEREVAGSKRVQEEPAQCSLPQEAAGVGEEGGKKEEEMEGRHDGDGASSSEDDDLNIRQEDRQSNRDQQQPEPAAPIPELIRNDLNQQAGNCLAHQRNRRTRFTHSQLHDLERLFQETRFPSLRVRRDLARWMGVDESDVHDWFKMRRSLFRRHSRLLMFCEPPQVPESDSP